MRSIRLTIPSWRCAPHSLTISVGFAVAMAAGPALAVPDCQVPAPPQEMAYPGAIELRVDATDINHRVFHVRETLPVSGGQELVLLYPEWLPGAHAPSGRNRLNKLAGLTVEAHDAILGWSRDPCNVFSFRIAVPSGSTSVTLEFDYLSPDSAQTEPGGSPEVTPDILMLDWSSLVLYPAGYFVGRIEVDPSVVLPVGWEFATSLERVAGQTALASFKPVSLETLVDSPIYSGRYLARWDLDPGAAAPVQLDAFADRPDLLSAADLAANIAHYRVLIQQAYKLFGSRHYEHYNFLLTLSDHLPQGGGLEHHQSSENNAPAAYFTEWGKMVADRDLVTHEFTHSWNGKFRLPQDLWAGNYNVPISGSLLWMYEGQTEYWGKVLAARSGLWSREEALESLASVAASFKTMPGRKWRSLQDTTFDEIIAPRFLPQPWGSWRRARDYYDEGALLWLDVDTLIREESRGTRSLDDFARSFFAGDDGSLGPKLYTFGDIVDALNAVQPYDWAAFLRERLDALDRDPLDGITRGGYRLVYSDVAGEYHKSEEALSGVTDFIYSMGLSIDKNGKVKSVLWDGPAFAAGLSAGVQIEAVNGIGFDLDRFKEMVRNSPTTSGAIELTVKDQDHFRPARIDYHDGLRYPHLERVPGTPARLDDILAAR